ncbi:hypothetical protein F3J23_06880 [Chryseobacterium sp. Tr-659]|uniref:hypothetical protein n=1 Tax=Chryseobacterium sp. Tr-659 TaxID=2608340 RepID=UPI00142256FC|nr:hypothetical protein [Chryseobacterium sp. Tr-659]NIF05164.1 hypothetical protein [Chryseobacterium sp. Tr-659]
MKIQSLMSKIFFFSLLFFSLTINAQVSNCKSAHIGKFELDSGEYGVFVVERNLKTQTEKNEKLGFKAIYDIVWKDDCHYELKNRKIIKGEILEGSSPNDVVKVEIVKVVDGKVFLKIGSNFSDEEMECEMTKIK